MKDVEVCILMDAMVKSALVDYHKAVANNDVEDMKNIEDWFDSQEVSDFVDWYYPQPVDVTKLLSLCKERTMKGIYVMEGE